MDEGVKKYRKRRATGCYCFGWSSSSYDHRWRYYRHRRLTFRLRRPPTTDRHWLLSKSGRLQSPSLIKSNVQRFAIRNANLNCKNNNLFINASSRNANIATISYEGITR
uniref:Uncharacterized protein n=1 Tax=Romanomermis culicivorax TaxID=13658 RepID=A0A915HJL4_ROMCU